MKRFFNKLEVKRKMALLYILCVVLPIIISDGFVFKSIYNSEKSSILHQMENEANAINYTFFNQVDEAAKLGNALYSSLYVHRFLHKEYSSNLEYYNAYQTFFDDTLLKLVTGQSGMEYCIYLDNNTITNGAEFQKITKAIGTDWYDYILTSHLNKGLYFGMTKKPTGAIQRTIYYFQRLNYYKYNSPNILLIKIDYSKCVDDIENLNYPYKAYICDDTRVLMSNGRYSNVSKEYANKDLLENIAYSQECEVYGQKLEIKIKDTNYSFIDLFRKRWYQLLFLIVINIALPVFVSSLMHTNLKNRLREQEAVVARKNAELIALHSQINPHFLFNALESIRMHSLLKKEEETAKMVEHLAKLQRQYTEWNDDIIAIENELNFVEAYLQLQKYRFGDRLSFEIDIEDECRKLLIPKLTLVTFVENAVVHGIESKTTPGWIFVRIYVKGENVIIEIEDTGSGIPENIANELLENMRNADISMLKEKGRVGIVNACVRLKMISEDDVMFDMDSEIGTGTLFQITIPMTYLKGMI